MANGPLGTVDRVPRMSRGPQRGWLTLGILMLAGCRYGEAIPGAIGQIEEISGTHSKSTEGIFIAAGPVIDPTVEPGKIHSLDITPTVLFALGLPVAEDFDGAATTEIFTDDFRDRFPLQTIPTWGVRDQREAPDSQADEELLEELRALGYLNE